MIYCFLKNSFQNIVSYIENQVKYEYQESIKDSFKLQTKNFGKPFMRTKNPEFFFLLELVIILFLSFSVYKWFSFYLKIANFTPNLMENQWDITQIPYDQVERLEIVRESWLKWYAYFYREGIAKAEEQALYYMNLGNTIRPLVLDTYQYIIIPLSIGYIVWFCIKYYEYVIAAAWGWFIMMYSFMTKKVECTLAKKWYIQFVTGWKKCSPSFSKYLRDWYVRFIQRPLRQEQLNYMRAYDELKLFQRKSSLNVLWDGIKNAIESLFKIIKQMFQKLYNIIYNFFASIGQLFLKIYNFILSLFGISYKSESTTGESCDCDNNTSKSNESKSNESKSKSNSPENPNNTSNTSNTSNECKDSLFIDLIIIFICLLPFKKYIPWQKITDSIQNFLLSSAQRFNISQTTIQVLFYSSLAIVLYLIDVYFYF
jgi:hypothetical protein